MSMVTHSKQKKLTREKIEHMNTINTLLPMNWHESVEYWLPQTFDSANSTQCYDWLAIYILKRVQRC